MSTAIVEITQFEGRKGANRWLGQSQIGLKGWRLPPVACWSPAQYKALHSSKNHFSASLSQIISCCKFTKLPVIGPPDPFSLTNTTCRFNGGRMSRKTLICMTFISKLVVLRWCINVPLSRHSWNGKQVWNVLAPEGQLLPLDFSCWIFSESSLAESLILTV